MHIDSYQFGEIVIDGARYDSDVIILGGAVQSNWWRSEGHSLGVEDLTSVIEAKPSVLVVGCGASRPCGMDVPGATQQFLKEKGIQLEAMGTYKAVEKFNELSEAGVNVAAALHLTC